MQDTCVDFISVEDTETPEEWVPFWFEANMAFGRIDCPARWESVKNVYDTETLKAAQFAQYGKANRKPEDLKPGELMNFGLRWEHNGELTLGAWAKENGMYKWLFGNGE